MGYLNEEYKKGKGGSQSDWDTLHEDLTAWTTATTAGDYAAAAAAEASVLGRSSGTDGTKLFTQEEFDQFEESWRHAQNSSSPPDTGDWLNSYVNEVFIDKSTSLETYSIASSKDIADLTAAIDLIDAGDSQIGKAVLEQQLAMAEAGLPIQELDYESSGDVLEASLANRVRWSEQCYLSYHIDSLSSLHRLYNRDYSYVDVVRGKPSEFTNRLFHYPHSGDFVDIKTDEASELMPLLSLSKVMYSWEEDKDTAGAYHTNMEAEVPLIFEQMAREDLLGAGASNQPENMSTNFASPTGFGWEKFSWKYIGSNPETVRNDITAELTLTFQDFNQLAKKRVYSPDPVGLNMNPDAIEYSLLDLLGHGQKSYRRFEHRADEYHEKFFEIKAVCGWNPAPSRWDAESSGRQAISRAVKNQKVVLYLTLIDHTFNINDIGTFTLHLTYRARLGSLLTEPKADILQDKDYRSKLSAISEEMEGHRRDCDFEQLDKAKTEYYEAIDSSRQTILQDILNRLINVRNDEDLVPRGTRQAHDEVPGLTLSGLPKKDPSSSDSKDEGLRGRIYVVNPTVKDLANFASGAPLESSGTSADAPEANAGTDVAQILASLVDAETGYDPESPLLSLRTVSPDKEVSAGADGEARARVPFFYLGDLVEVVTWQALNEDHFELGERGSLTPEEANNIKVILGTYEFFNGKENKIINLADVPISVRSFTDFWYKNVVVARKEKYLLLHFIRDVIDQLVIKALGADCLGYNGHPLGSTPVRLRTAFISLAPKTSSDPKDPLLNLGTEAYADDDQSGHGTILLDQINKGIEKASPEDYLLTPEVDSSYKIRDHSREISAPVNSMYHYLVVYAQSTIPWDLKGDEEEDYKKGIFHLKIHQGILHQARFKKTDQPALREARYERMGYDPLVHLSNVYDVELEMLGNTIFYPGSYVFINPLGFGTALGSPMTQNSISNAMGLGGYHFITEVSNTIGKTFSTSMKVRWDNNGANSVRTVTMQKNRDSEGNCKPVPSETT